jgi:hypothetical protein
MENQIENTLANRKIFFQSTKHTSEYHKYDEFMCIMYDAFTKGEVKQKHTNKQVQRQGVVCCVTVATRDESGR